MGLILRNNFTSTNSTTITTSATTFVNWLSIANSNNYNHSTINVTTEKYSVHVSSFSFHVESTNNNAANMTTTTAIRNSNHTSYISNGCGNSTLLYNEYILALDVVRFGMPVIYTLSIILSMCGNLFWIIFMWKSSKYSKSSNVILILNLAVCDFVKSTVVAPLRVIELFLSRYHSDEVDCCRSLNFFTLYLALAGFHSVVAISQERLVLICFPFHARKWFGRNVALIVILLIWTTSFVVSLPFALLYSQAITIPLTYGEVFHMCSVNFFHSDKATGARLYTLVITIFYYVIPVLIISVSYVKVFISLNKTIHNLKTNASTKYFGLKTDYGSSMRKDENSLQLSMIQKSSINSIPEMKMSSIRNEHLLARSSSNSTLKIIQRRRTLAQMMVVVAVCFIIFQGPIVCLYLYLSFGYRIERNAVFTLILFKWFPMVSSMINPFVYSTGWKVFRNR